MYCSRYSMRGISGGLCSAPPSTSLVLRCSRYRVLHDPWFRRRGTWVTGNTVGQLGCFRGREPYIASPVARTYSTRPHHHNRNGRDTTAL